MQVVDEYEDNQSIGMPFLPWLVCLCASLFFFYEFIQGNMFASIADSVMQDFNVQADKMAYLSSIYYVANVIFLVIAGFILDRFSAKTTILVAMFFCVICTFVFAQTQSFYLALFCRFITGIGSAFCFLGPLRLSSRWFPPQRMALVTGLIVTIAMLGGMLAQYPLTLLVAQVGWREALTQVGWLGVVMLVIMYFGIIEKVSDSDQQNPERINLLKAAKDAYLNPQTLKAAVCTSLINMSIAVYGAMMGSLYLVQRLGVTKETASVVNSMLFLGAIIGGPFIGWCSDKLGLRLLPMKVSVFISLLVVFVIVFFPVSLPMMKILFFLLGFFTASQVISYALVAETSSPLITATAVSVVSVLTQGGCVVYQNLFSIILINHGGMHMSGGVPVYSLGDYQYASLIFPLGLMVALFLLFGLKETYCRQVAR